MNFLNVNFSSFRYFDLLTVFIGYRNMSSLYMPFTPLISLFLLSAFDRNLKTMKIQHLQNIFMKKSPEYCYVKLFFSKINSGSQKCSAKTISPSNSLEEVLLTYEMFTFNNYFQEKITLTWEIKILGHNNCSESL